MIGSVLPFFSAPVRQILLTLPTRIQAELQEIRIRESRPLEVIWSTGHGFVAEKGGLSPNPEQAYRATHKDCATLLELLTQHSMYTFEEELKRGFITVAGGHRIGLSGRTVVEQGKVKYIKDISGFNIRLAREWKKAAAGALPFLLEPRDGSVYRTLVISPPQQGKTTFIRDLARLLSSGGKVNESGRSYRSFKVGIVDERSEIAACVKGVPTFDVGPRTDVLDGCPKAEGMMMMIRSMSPEVLIADEIGRAEDAAAIHEALHAGISIVATAHGRDIEDAKRRPILRELLEAEVFDRFVVLHRRTGAAAPPGPNTSVFDQIGKRMDDRLALRGGMTL
ncbi:stage III sporulation protein AA [Paenibacillus naphthalenovorans]|uniref:Stage III sporulation protein AA n=1 Tax=Paenibacillus naphthalenovorans TaxID=162209 RepID=A0A0U2VH74_9BACL|nr:stage III sporulation protein AA [Paenibacillus naphthalenovorans]ALS22803.1 stage III sporulation protein AA [Paenibacillus naphthalenovorans]